MVSLGAVNVPSTSNNNKVFDLALDVAAILLNTFSENELGFKYNSNSSEAYLLLPFTLFTVTVSASALALFSFFPELIQTIPLCHVYFSWNIPFWKSDEIENNTSSCTKYCVCHVNYNKLLLFCQHTTGIIWLLYICTVVQLYNVHNCTTKYWIRIGSHTHTSTTQLNMHWKNELMQVINQINSIK